MDRAKLLVLNTNKNDPALPYLQLGAMARQVLSGRSAEELARRDERRDGPLPRSRRDGPLPRSTSPQTPHTRTQSAAHTHQFVDRCRTTIVRRQKQRANAQLPQAEPPGRATSPAIRRNAMSHALSVSHPWHLTRHTRAARSALLWPAARWSPTPPPALAVPAPAPLACLAYLHWTPPASV